MVVILGGALRMYRLGANSFLADEFLDMNSAYGYYKTGIWQAWDFNLNQPSDIDVYAERDERAWLYKWQVAQLFRFFPPTEAVARSVSVAWGIATIFIIYFAAYYFTKRRTIGFISAFLFAVNMTAIVFDRKLRMYAMFYPMYLLLSLFLYQFFEADYNGKNRLVKYFYDRLEINVLYLVPLLIALSICLSIQLLTVNIGAVFLIYVIMMFFKKWIAKERLGKYLLVIALMAIFLISAYIFIPGKTLRFYTGLLKFFIDNDEYFMLAVRDFSVPAIGVLLAVSGAYYMFRKKLFNQALWISLSLMVPLIMAAYMWKRSTGSQYIFAFQPFLIILAASGIFFWAETAKRKLEIKLPNVSSYIMPVLTLVSFVLIPDYSKFWKPDNAYHRVPSAVANYRESFAEIKKQLKPEDGMITRNFRNYYLAEAEVPVFEFGGERGHKLKEEEIKDFQKKYSRVWVVLFDNDLDHVSKQANKYIKTNFTQIEGDKDKKNTRIYLWARE
jgi:hypothetical protein